MSSNFISRNRKTLLFSVIALIPVAVSLLVKGKIAETLMPFMFFFGFSLLFYTILRPWGKPEYYVVMIIISVVLFAILFMGGFNILVKLTPPGKSDEDLIWSVGFAFIAGITAGLTDILTYSKVWQRLIYSGTALSLLAFTILFTCVTPPNLKNSIRIGEFIILGLQLIITSFLIYIGYIDKKTGRLSKISLLLIAITLIIISLTEFAIAPSVDGERLEFWKLSIEIYAVIEIIIAVITIIALQKAVRKVNS
jgi:hypothetical protein